MANTIKNFLIGIGYDYDSKGEKQIGSGIDSLKSKALQLGAVVAGGFGIKSLTSDFADAKDRLGLFSDVFGITVENLKALGEAATKEGGSLEGTLSTLEQLEKTRAALKKGDASIFGAAGKAGGNAKEVVEAKDSLEALLVVADQLEGLEDPQQQLNLAEAYGLDAVQLRFLKMGSKRIRELIEDQKRLNLVTKEQTDIAREWKRQTHTLGQNVEWVGNKVSTKLLPVVSELISDMNKWIAVNREVADSGIDDALDIIAENFGLVSGVLGIIAGSAAFGVLFKFGRLIPIFGGLAVAVGGIGLALMSWAAAAFAAWQIGTKLGELANEQIDDTVVGDAVGEGIARVLAFAGNDEAQAAVAANDQREEDEKERKRIQTENVLKLDPAFTQNDPNSDIPTVLPSEFDPGNSDIPMMPKRDLQTQDFERAMGDIQSSTNKIDQEIKLDIKLNGDAFESAVGAVFGKEVDRSIQDTKSTVAG